MGQVIGALAGSAAVIAGTLVVFVGANALVEQAPRRFRLFTTLAGAVIGAALGAVANSGGWFVGGPAWPAGGAALGAVLGFGAGTALEAAPRTRRLVPPLAGVIIGALVGFVVGGVANAGSWFVGGANWLGGGAGVGAGLGLLLGLRRAARRDPTATPQRWRIPQRLQPLIFLAPALFFLGVTLVVPTLRTIWLSFQSRRGEEFVGADNYSSIFTDGRLFNIGGLSSILTSRLFLIGVILAGAVTLFVILRGTSTRRGIDLSAPLPSVSLTTAAVFVLLAAVSALGGVIWNNVFWLVFVTGLSVIFGLGIAVLADRSRGESVAKSLIFMPMAISFVGASVIWRFVYAVQPEGRSQTGVLNAIWVGLGGDPQFWLQDQPWNTFFLIVVMIWIQTGFAMVVFSSAIKGVPGELIEAAKVDGANELQTFWRVIMPHIRSTIAVVATTITILVLKIFDIVKVMTGGEFGTNVLANQMFDEVFTNRDNGRGSALAVLILVAVIPLMIGNARRARRAEQAA